MTTNTPVIEGTVTNVARTRCVADINGNPVEFHVPGGIIRANGGRNPVRVGDRVSLTLRSGTIVLDKIAERDSTFERTHSEPGRSDRRSAIAANLALALFVLPATFSEGPLRMLDRMLVGACEAEIDAAICINKWDLVSDHEGRRDRLRPYRQAGWRLFFTTAPAGDGVGELTAYLPAGLSAFVGPSGAGKTTLIAAITGRTDLKTEAVNALTGKGRHATTAVSAYAIGNGRWVVDAPGLKTFGVGQATGEAVMAAFPQIESASSTCRQRWCTHQREPGCGIQAGLSAGQIDLRRWQSFQILMAEASD